MGDVVDIRPDRFLREMREHGQWDVACEISGLTHVELEELCIKDIKFDRSQVECLLEYLEDKLTQQAVDMVKVQTTKARKIAMAALATRHPNG